MEKKQTKMTVKQLDKANRYIEKKMLEHGNDTCYSGILFDRNDLLAAIAYGMSIATEKDKTPFDWMDESFKTPMKTWLDYKSSRNQSYKSNESIKACYNKLYKMSNGNAQTAMEIVEQSMANNWAGLFELRQPSVSIQKSKANDTMQAAVNAANNIKNRMTYGIAEANGLH